jgi:hypothetical protein
LGQAQNLGGLEHVKERFAGLLVDGGLGLHPAIERNSSPKSKRNEWTNGKAPWHGSTSKGAGYLGQRHGGTYKNPALQKNGHKGR